MLCYTGSNAWNNLVANLAIGGLIAHTVLFWGPQAIRSLKQAKSRSQPDRHWQVCILILLLLGYEDDDDLLISVTQAMQKYKEAPWYWYAGLLVLAFFAGKHMIRRVPQ